MRLVKSRCTSDNLKMQNEQLETLSHSETLSFLEIYLDGIMTEGLLLPLLKMSKEKNSISPLSGSFFSNMMSVMSPQNAIDHLNPGFPDGISEVLKYGFESSKLDYVIIELIDILKESEIKTIEQRLKNFDFKEINKDSICLGCAYEELEKIIRRSNTEGAPVVFLQQEDDFFTQKYVSIKPVIISEPAVFGVCTKIEFLLKDAYETEKTINLQSSKIHVSSSSEGSYRIEFDSSGISLNFS